MPSSSLKAVTPHRLLPMRVLGRNGMHRQAFATIEAGAVNLYTGTVTAVYPLVSFYGSPDEIVAMLEALAAGARAARTQQIVAGARGGRDA